MYCNEVLRAWEKVTILNTSLRPGMFCCTTLSHALYSAECSSVKFSTVQCPAVQCSAVQCNTAHCNIVQCRAVYCSEWDKTGTGRCTALWKVGAYYRPPLNGLHRTVLDWTALHCNVLHCTVLQCTALYCNVLHCNAMYCNVL